MNERKALKYGSIENENKERSLMVRIQSKKKIKKKTNESSKREDIS